VSSIAFDLNGVIHKARVAVYGISENLTEEAKLARYNSLKKISPESLEAEMFLHIENKILEVISAFRVRDVLILTIDGVAPSCKLQQQRSRRFQREDPRYMIFDKNSITPGTDFM